MKRKKTVYIVEDKIFELLINRLKLSPLLIGFSFSALPLVLLFILSIVWGEFKSHGDVIGYVEDYTLFANLILGAFPVVTYFFLMPIFLQECFENLRINKVFSLSKTIDNATIKYQKFDEFILDVKKSLSSKLWVILGIVLSTIFLAMILPGHLEAKHWIVKYKLSFVIIEFVWWVLFSITVIFIFRTLVGIWWINQAFRVFRINVRPLYPDRVGGLKPLSQFSLRLGYIIFFFGLELGFNQYFTGQKMTGVLGHASWTFDIILVWGVYIILAPLAFFAPIGAAHDAMQKAKDAEILLISGYFEKEYKLLRNNLGQSIKYFKKRSNKIEELRKLYAMIDSFPVWPFQLQKIAQFFATVLSPLILTIMSSLVTSWLTK